MSTFSKEEISRRLSQTLDCLGYSSEMIQFRRNLYFNYDFISNFFGNQPCKTKTVGSRGEGIVKLNESDWDVLFLVNFVLVVEDHIATGCIPESLSVFHMLPCLLHPGHYKLLLLRYGTEDMYTLSCLNPFENGCYLSSKEFITLHNKDNLTLSGPAQTLASNTAMFSFDGVHTIPCVCPSIIQQWVQRPRRYEWPSSELRKRISCMPANIVATGHQGCSDEEIEWRLCFNEIELLLVDSWNETQQKLYKVLKMIKKDVFVKAGFEISSYIMKNILLWLSETYPQSSFRPEFLMAWIIKSLRLLRKVVKVYCLPYYMIPGRNLIAERIPRRECKRLMREIYNLIHCGPQLLWKCEKLEFAMTMTPNELLYYKYLCDRLEVYLLIDLMYSKYARITNTDFEPTYDSELFAITMNLQWPPAVTEILKDKSFLERIQTLLG